MSFKYSWNKKHSWKQVVSMIYALGKYFFAKVKNGTNNILLNISTISNIYVIITIISIINIY